MSHWHLRRAAAAAVCGLLLANPAQAQTLTVEVELNAAPSADETALRSVLDGSPIRLVARGATTTIETDAPGYKKLLADENIRSVRLVAGTVPPATTNSIEFQIALTTAREGPGTPALELNAARAARHSARVVSRGPSSGLPRMAEQPRPGALTVRGLARDGEEIGRAVIEDPRVVRFEAAGANGRLSGRRDFIRAEAQFRVALPADPRVATLTISDFIDGAEREIARMPAR